PPVLPPPGRHQATVAAVAVPPPPGGPTERLPLGTICGARSGDKGGNANVGVWARNAAAYAWRAETLTVDTVRRLVPEAAARPSLRGSPAARPRPGAGATTRTSGGARSPRSGGRSS